MGCENSNEIKDFNKTAPINRGALTPNNVLLSPLDSDNKDKINNRRSSQAKIFSLRRSIFEKDNNIPYEISQLKNRKRSFSQLQKKNESNFPQYIKIKTKNTESQQNDNKELILDLSNNRKKSLKRHSQLYKKTILIDNKNNENHFNKLFDGKIKPKSTPIHFNNSLNSFRQLSQSKSLKNSNDLYSISKDDTNPKKIIKQNNEKNIRRQSLNLKKRNINLVNNSLYKSANNFYNIQNDFVEPIKLRDSKRKKSYLPGVNPKYTLDEYSNYKTLNENNSFRRESLKIKLSRKNPNPLFQNEINTKDNKSKTPIKLFTKENIAIKRNSVSIPKKYFKNEFEGRKEKRHLSKISEVPILNSFLKEISDFHNLNKELFSDIEKLIYNKDELHNKFLILITKNYNFNKNSNEEPKYEENIKIRIINRKMDNNWDIEPLKIFKENIEKLFQEDKYKEYADLSFAQKFKEYEKIPKKLKFPLITLYPKFNQSEEIVFDFSKYSNVITIFFFDDSEDSINTLKIISNFYSNNISMFHFIPIYCHHINNTEESIDIFSNIKNNYNINIGNQEIYFIIKNKSKIIDNFFSYYDKSIPIIYIIDKNYYIRAITDIKNFHLNMIKNAKTKIEKDKYIEQVKKI